MKEGNMKRILRDERGMALAVAIFALVVVGALVAGAFFAGTQEQRVGENQRRVQTSFGVAEAGAQARVLTWVPATMNKRPLYCPCPAGDSVLIPDTPAPSGSGSYGGGGARQRIGLITRIAPVQFGIAASLTTQGGVSLQGNANVNGADQIPTGWTSCDPPGVAMPGIRDNGGNVTTGGNGNVVGNPAVVNDPTLDNTDFTQFGGATYAQMTARATITLPSGNYTTQPVLNGAGNCDNTVLTNWGDGQNPGSKCADYFPIIHIAGSATLNGDQGQGILLVDGDLIRE